MAKNKRVFEVAKELGVSSKDIVFKCEAEGIPGIKNHMSTVSLGLAATILEWFGGGGGGVATAVEVAAPVDLESARAKVTRKAARKRTKRTDAEDKAVESSIDAGAKAAVPMPTEPVVLGETQGKVVDDGDENKVAPSAVPEAPVESEVPAVAAKALAEKKTPEAGQPPKPEAPVVVMNVPERPTDVKPVGPMLAEPSRTKLAGPKVVRVEAPDVLPAPRSRRETRAEPPLSQGRPRSGQGIGFRTPPVDEPAGKRAGRSASRRNKRRSQTGESRRTAPGSKIDKPLNWREQDLVEREQRLNRAGGFFRTHRRDIQRRTAARGRKASTAAETGGKVAVAEPITVKGLSGAAGVKASEIVKKLFLSGNSVTINSLLDSDTAIAVMLEFGIELEVVEQKTAESEIIREFARREMVDERTRPPVVTILGHVDHGKTSLLDRIRNTNVAEGEAGGITQATSAFRVSVRAGDEERQIVFLDTPGHEAFTEMRARGARVTDLVVLVVAADDGVMPQTIESINHAKAASVPVIVALNKIDKPEANDEAIQRIFGQLAEHGLNPSDWGGDTEVVRTSAITGEGVQDLLEHIDYQSQLHEWKADFGGPAEGTVIEAHLAEGRGPVARILVQQGMLARGDFVAIGRGFGRVRDIIDDRGQRIDSAGPSTPVAVSGIDEVPDAGDKVYAVKTLKAAEAAALERRESERERDLVAPKITLDNIFDRLAEGEKKSLRLIIKADVQGSVETLKKTLSAIDVEDVSISVLHSGVGGVNESDITLAEASEAIIIGFNVTTQAKGRKVAEAKGVDIRLYDVIYDITDDVEKAAKGLLDPEHRLEVLGHAEVRQVFRISRVGMVAGCYVTDGSIQRNAQIRITRDDIVVEKDRRLEQLKRFKEDAREVRAGQECGMKIDGYDDIKEGDILECYRTVEVARD